jgi:hypothetical protein
MKRGKKLKVLLSRQKNRIMLALNLKYSQKKNSMQKISFIDTNVFVYAYTADDTVKHTRALALLNDTRARSGEVAPFWYGIGGLTNTGDYAKVAS